MSGTTRLGLVLLLAVAVPLAALVVVLGLVLLRLALWALGWAP